MCWSASGRPPAPCGGGAVSYKRIGQRNDERGRWSYAAEDCGCYFGTEFERAETYEDEASVMIRKGQRLPERRDGRKEEENATLPDYCRPGRRSAGW